MATRPRWMAGHATRALESLLAYMVTLGSVLDAGGSEAPALSETAGGE